MNTPTRAYRKEKQRGIEKLNELQLKKQKAVKFVEHIEEHLHKMEREDGIEQKVICKICDKNIDEIYEEVEERAIKTKNILKIPDGERYF